MIDELPRKLLDCPMVRTRDWPAAFYRLGPALRLDYSTPLHGGWEAFYHPFSSGVRVYSRWPERGADAALYDVAPAIDPLVLGLADRLYLQDASGKRVIYARSDLAADESDARNARVMELPPTVVAWDVEGTSLALLDSRGKPTFVLRDGLLALSKDGMVLG